MLEPPLCPGPKSSVLAFDNEVIGIVIEEIARSIARLNDVFPVGLRHHQLNHISEHGIVKRVLNNAPNVRHTGFQQHGNSS